MSIVEFLATFVVVAGLSAQEPAAIRDVRHQPIQPKPDVTVRVTARMPPGTTRATLKLQAVTPGEYVRKSDPAYEKGWTDLPMRDDGQEGDSVSQGDDAAAAGAAFREAVRLAPNLAMAHLSVGMVLLKEGDTHAAIEAIDRAVELEPDTAIAHSLLGEAHERSGQLQRAIACYRQATRVEPGEVSNYQKLASALKVSRDPAGALACRGSCSAQS